MGSEIQSGNGSGPDLRDIQETYRQRRKSVEAEGESEVEKARNDNQKQLKAENEANAAAINHVRTNGREQLEQLKADTDQRLTYERKDLSKRYQTARESGTEQLESERAELHGREAHLQKQAEGENRREAELQSRASEATSKFAKQENEKRAQIISSEQQDMRETQKNIAQKKLELEQKGHRDIATEGERNHQALEQLRAQDQDTLAKVSKRGETEIKLQRDHQSVSLDSERNEFQKNQQQIRQRADGELRDLQENSTHKIALIKKDDEHQTQMARDTGVKDLEKTRAYYVKNVNEIHKQGNQELTQKKEIQEHQVAVMDQQQKQQMERLKNEHEAQSKESEGLYKKQEETAKAYYQDSLLQQHQRFDQAFNDNINQFNETVHSQKEKLMTTLAKEKRTVMEDVGKYNAKNHDPFYRIVQPRAELHETNDHYVVTAHVPEHEKDNVHVVIHDDKVVLAGDRRFEDKLEDQEGKIATHNFQSFRQEIPLEHPVRERLAQSSYDNGVLTIRIPKA